MQAIKIGSRWFRPGAKVRVSGGPVYHCQDGTRARFGVRGIFTLVKCETLPSGSLLLVVRSDRDHRTFNVPVGELSSGFDSDRLERKPYRFRVVKRRGER